MLSGTSPDVNRYAYHAAEFAALSESKGEDRNLYDGSHDMLTRSWITRPGSDKDAICPQPSMQL